MYISEWVITLVNGLKNTYTYMLETEQNNSEVNLF